jgi:hypothetical protein
MTGARGISNAAGMGRRAAARAAPDGGRRDTALQERQRQPQQQTPETAVQLALDGGL